MRAKIIFCTNLFLFLIFITSCGSKFSLQKRRYNKGFHFSVARELSSGKPGNKIFEMKWSSNPASEEPVLVVANLPELKTVEKKSENTDIKITATATDLAANDPKSDIESVSSVQTGEFEKNERVDRKKGAARSFKEKKAAGLLNVLSDITTGLYIIYLIIGIISVVWFLFQYYTFAQLLPYIIGFILFLLLCYLIGSAVR